MLLFRAQWWDKRWKLTKGAEYDEGERVTNDPLADSSEYHEDAAEEEVCSWTQIGVRLSLIWSVG